MKKFLLSKFLFLLLLVSSVAWAQEKTVSGKVTSSEDGAALPGVSVLQKGTSNGTVTDAEGKYSLLLNGGGQTLIFSFVGMKSSEIEIGERSIVDVALGIDVTQLSEVVVTGYATQAKRDLSGTIASVSGKEIAALPVQSFDQALQGRAAGVNVTTPNGVLNNPPVIRIRGVNSISLSSFPLVVIDGVPTFSGDLSQNSAANNPLSSINPSDIESVEILKDASAAAIYGSRASSGVILITTKRGSEGKSKITLDTWYGVTEPFRLVDVLNTDQYLLIKNEGAKNAGLPQQFFRNQDASGKDIDTRWYDEIYRKGIASNVNLGLSGGTKSTNYFVSVARTKQDGFIKANSFERVNLRLNLDAKVNEWIKVGTTFNYTNSENQAPNTGSLAGTSFNTSGIARLGFVTAPIVGPYLNDGTYNIASNNQIGRLNNLQQVGFTNPVPVLDKNRFISQADQVQANLYAMWEPIKGLSLRSSYGIDRIAVEDIAYQTPIHGDGFTNNGTATNTLRTNDRWNWQNVLQFTKQIKNKHNILALVGTEEQYTDQLGWGIARQNVADPFFESIQGNWVTPNPSGNIQGENYLASTFGSLNYDFGKKYFLTANIRRDGYSAFAKNKKYGTFYGAALSYALSEEAFYKNSGISKVLSFFKLKASYGTVGNVLGLNDFASLQLYSSGLYGANPTLFYNQAGNTNLSWESSVKTDFGFNFGLFQDRIQGEVVYYQNNIEDMILPVPQSPSKGIPNNIIDQNIGAMSNKGIEISLNATAIQKGDFSWKVNFNLTTLQNEVTALAGGDIRTATAGLETANITRVGQSIGSLLVIPTVGINPANGRRLFQKADGSVVQFDFSAPSASRWTNLATGAIATQPALPADGVVIGPTLPTYYGGFDNTFTYKGFDLGIFFQYSGGNSIYNGTKAGLRDQRFWNNHLDVLNRWTPENTGGSIPRIVLGDNISNGSSFPISENVEKGDFIRLRNIMLGYNFKQNVLSRLHVGSIRVYAQVQNAFLITNYSGFDPEVSSNGNSTTGIGVDRNSVGQARTYTFGLNIGL
jgi:TonB-dependent starch-binding outer membrane protein SusC